MAHVALLSASDGRPAVSRDIDGFVRDRQARVGAALGGRGHQVTVASEPVCSNEAAVSTARRLADARPDLTVIYTPVWAFPHFTMLAAAETPGPIALFSTIEPAYPGMVGMLAAGGGLDQIGRVHGRAWGDPEDPLVIARLDALIAAGHATSSLRGTTFGRVGGRPMGMYTAVANPDQWIAQFGVDVEEIDQLELVRLADEADPARARAGREWLERTTAGVRYDGERLTPELLERQLCLYLAMRELIDTRRLDFCGIKAQPELTDHVCTADVAEALLNDPYDWEGGKPSIVCATEADMDGALTMRLLRALAGTPVLFADLRHYEAELDVWDLCNSGQHATWYAARADDAEENLRHVQLLPQDFYFPAGGAAVHHLAAPGEMTFARLTRLSGRYRMQVIRGRFERFDDVTNERVMQASSPVWPHAFARLEAPVDEVLGRYGSNHIHAVPGDHVAALRDVCRFLDVDFDGLGDLR